MEPVAKKWELMPESESPPAPPREKAQLKRRKQQWF